jgi:hypothetical protein
MQRIWELGTWVLVDPPKGANILGCKWVYDLKTNPDGTLERFKARLVAQGFGQKEGVDYDETFASTAGRTTVRAFLAMVACKGYKTRQLDVSTVFLYGNVDKPIFMRQPLGHDDGSGRVCRLIRSLYGLKQASRIWQKRLEESLRALGFVKSQMDPSLHILQEGGKVCYLVEFVDDMCLASDDDSLLDEITRNLSAEFKINDLGPVEKYVGLYIVRDLQQGEMWVHQAPYVSKMVTKYNISVDNCPETPLPYDFILETAQEYAARLLVETTKRSERVKSPISGLNNAYNQSVASICSVSNVLTQ